MDDADRLKNLFNRCMPYFIALGDEVRLHIVKTLAEQGLHPSEDSMENAPPRGMNVKEITDKTCLSRPAVSHHLRILKDSGLVHIRREGTCNYYYLTLKESTRQLMELGVQLQDFFDHGNK